MAWGFTIIDVLVVFLCHTDYVVAWEFAVGVLVVFLCHIDYVVAETDQVFWYTLSLFVFNTVVCFIKYL